MNSILIAAVSVAVAVVLIVAGLLLWLALGARRAMSRNDNEADR